MSVFDYYYYYYSAVFAGYPVIIKIAVFIILILFSLTVMSLIRFFYIRHKQILKAKRKKKIKKIYRANLIDILYFSFKELSVQDLNADSELPEPQKKWQKRMLTDLILKVKSDKSYEMDGGVFQSYNYINLLTYFKLYDYWVNEISSTDISKAIRALRVINEIGGGVRGSAFSSSVYHRNGYLRKFARMTYTRFDSHDPYKFLEQGLDDHFNKFDEKRLHYILIEMNKDHPIPLLTKWVRNSTKENYKGFLVREMGFFKQYESIPFLVELYKTEQSILVKCEIMETLGELEYEPLIDLAKEEFNSASKPLQTSIIEGLRLLKSRKSLPFLTETYQSTQFSETKIKIVEMLQEFDEEGMSILISLSEKSSSKFEENLFAYALN